jgi:hypothetical protein
MTGHLDQHREIEPLLIRRPHGDWLAVSPYKSYIQLGVTAPTEDEARNEFKCSVARWFEIICDTES